MITKFELEKILVDLGINGVDIEETPTHFLLPSIKTQISKNSWEPMYYGDERDSDNYMCMRQDIQDEIEYIQFKHSGIPTVLGEIDLCRRVGEGQKLSPEELERFLKDAERTSIRLEESDLYEDECAMDCMINDLRDFE